MKQGPFCNRIQVGSDTTSDPDRSDLEAVAALFLEENLTEFSLENTNSDAAFEVVVSGEGFGLLGAEDSARGTFAFQLHDPKGLSRIVTAGIHELPLSAFTRDRHQVMELATTWFETGELDPRVSWSLNIHTGESMHYDIVLPAGEERSLEEFVRDFGDGRMEDQQSQ